MTLLWLHVWSMHNFWKLDTEICKQIPVVKPCKYERMLSFGSNYWLFNSFKESGRIRRRLGSYVGIKDRQKNYRRFMHVFKCYFPILWAFFLWWSIWRIAFVNSVILDSLPLERHFSQLWFTDCHTYIEILWQKIL